MTTYTVAEVSQMVGRAIGRAFPEEVWIQGEIRDLNRAASGHVYFTLVDPDPEEAPAPMLPVTLFASDKNAVNRVLQRSGAVRMTDGVKVRIRGSVTHYAARGTVQLRMTWIDTDFTLGQLAAERDRLIRSLEQRGLLDKNRALSLPLVPLHVGLITSAGSAAEADFLHELEASGYAWRVHSSDARVQGIDAIPDIVEGIAALAGSGVDVVAIVRGGGAKTDLAVFDSEEIAVAVANCPVPVLSGIGHEVDVSVTDLVARSYKTPTACAAALVRRVSEFTGRLDQLAVATRRATVARVDEARRSLVHTTDRLARSSGTAASGAERLLDGLAARATRGGRGVLRREHDRVAEVGRRLHRAGTVHVDAAGERLDRMAAMVGHSATRRTGTARSRLGDLEHRLELLDPARVLARGWSITRTASGALVTDPDEVEDGAVLRTTLAGGELTSVVAEEPVDGR
jgi:exodeoxyribonuclease VII large subunit